MADESKIKIRAVLFDYGMVLSNVPEALDWHALENVLDAEEKPFQAAYWKYRDAYDRGALSAQAYWESVGRDLDRPIDAEVLRALIDADTVVWTQPNIGDAMELGVLGRFPALTEFTHHTFSHRLGIAKPDAEIYRHAMEGLAVPAAKILFVDDREENIVAARAAGMVAVQYLGHAGFVEEMERIGLGWLLRL